MWYSFSLEVSFKWESVNAKKRGVSSLQSWVRMGIFAMRPVAERRPSILANEKERWSNRLGGGFDELADSANGDLELFPLLGWR